MALNGLHINTLDDVEAARLVYALHKKLQQRRERKKNSKKANSTESRRPATK
jgi:hypothetical protein